MPINLRAELPVDLGRVRKNRAPSPLYPLKKTRFEPVKSRSPCQAICFLSPRAASHPVSPMNQLDFLRVFAAKMAENKHSSAVF